ncbi:MAG: arginyltransferase [Magnetococcales bacterium]|nr:arginyltransferase [Magnetococcales bacterium]
MNFDPSSQAGKLRLALFLTPPHPCGYLNDLMASTLFVDPHYTMTVATYRYLLERGFRRSGSQVYRPYCGSCQACIPARIPVDSFKLGRSFRRVWKKNQDLQSSNCEPGYTEERFALYQSYLGTRHDEGPMANPSPDDFIRFLGCGWGETQFIEFRLQGRLVMVSVIDQQPDSLSAVYAYFDPALSYRSLGTYSILWEVERAKREGKKWLYLGYWVEDCQKMSYKARFHPLELYRQQKWGLMTREESASTSS